MDINISEAAKQENAEVFLSYAREDEELCKKLEAHLSLLKRQGTISTWHDRNINAGSEWKRDIDAHLNMAQIILLLVSPDFIASDYCYSTEMTRAMERHDSGEARVIPIILRPVDWQRAPFGKLQALPRDAKPVTDWSSQDQAFYDIVQGIRSLVETFVSPRSGQGSPPTALSYPIRLSYTAPPFLKQAVEMLDSEQQARRKEGIELLRQTDHPLVREIFTAALQHPIRDVRIQAAVSLLRFGPPSVPEFLPALREALYQETDPRWRADIVRNLGKVGGASIVSDLSLVRHDADPYVREVVVDVLGNIGGDEALSLLSTFLQDPDVRVRTTVGRALHRIGGTEASSQLLRFLDDPDPQIRRDIVSHLGTSGDTATVVPALLYALRDSDRLVRQRAARALSWKGSVAVPGLREALRDSNSETKRFACEALGTIGDLTAVPDLLQVLHDPGAGPTLRDKQEAQYGATEALGKIGDPVGIDDILQTMGWVVSSAWRGSDEPVISALTTLASKGNAGIPRLLQARGDPNEQIRRLAVRTLERMGVK
jgi:HEAT repeat protein